MMLNIRKAVRGDAPVIYDMILKMAEYEKLEDEVDTSLPEIERTIFDEKQAEVIIGEADGWAVGMALYFFNYSTFKGRRGIWLEDLFVYREHRGKGYGKALLLELIKIAAAEGCRRVEWTVLDWNAPAIGFYKSLGAVPMEGWTTFRLTEEKINGLMNK